MPHLQGVLAVLVTVILASIAQIIIKLQLSKIGPVPNDPGAWLRYTFDILTNPLIIFAFGMAFVGAMIYLFAISRLNITYLYPVASLSFPTVLLLGVFVIGEPMSWQKAGGSLFIIAGVMLSATSRG